MPFNDEGLQRTVYGGALGNQGPDATNVMSVWHYITNDADTVVEADAYFDSTAMLLGDLLFGSLDVDGTPEVKAYVVSVGNGLADGTNDVTVVPMLIA